MNNYNSNVKISSSSHYMGPYTEQKILKEVQISNKCLRECLFSLVFMEMPVIGVKRGGLGWSKHPFPGQVSRLFLLS